MELDFTIERFIEVVNCIYNDDSIEEIISIIDSVSKNIEELPSNLSEEASDVVELIYNYCYDDSSCAVEDIDACVEDFITHAEHFQYSCSHKNSEEFYDYIAKDRIMGLLDEQKFEDLLCEDRDDYARSKGIIISILSEHFSNGINLGENSQIGLLRAFGEIEYEGFEFPQTDRGIKRLIVSMSTQLTEDVWQLGIARVSISDETRKAVFDVIEGYKYSIITVDKIYTIIKEVAEKDLITSKYIFGAHIDEILGGKYEHNKDFIVIQHGKRLCDAIEEYILASNQLVTKAMITSEFSGVTDVMLYNSIDKSKIINMHHYFTHVDRLGLTKVDLNKWCKAVTVALVENRTYHIKEIFNSVKNSIPGIFDRLGVDHYLQVFYVTEKFFKNEFSFDRPYIAKKGVVIKSANQLIYDKIKELGVADIAEIGRYSKQISGGIGNYFQFFTELDGVVFYNRNQVVTTALAEIYSYNFKNIDKILNEYIGNENYKPLDFFIGYDALPKINFKWNEWLFGSVINMYSRRYCVVSSKNMIADARLYLVRKDIDIDLIQFGDNSTENENSVAWDFDLNTDILDFLDLEDFD